MNDVDPEARYLNRLFGGRDLLIAGNTVAAVMGGSGTKATLQNVNSFSRVAVYERPHGDWSVSPAYNGPRPDTRFMDIDSAASTPILGLQANLSNAGYLRYELTALAYQLKNPGFTALVIGPGGGRDLASALVFGAALVATPSAQSRKAPERPPASAPLAHRRSARFRSYQQQVPSQQLPGPITVSSRSCTCRAVM